LQLASRRFNTQSLAAAIQSKRVCAHSVYDTDSGAAISGASSVATIGTNIKQPTNDNRSTPHDDHNKNKPNNTLDEASCVPKRNDAVVETAGHDAQ
jgi:hypothetical protein